MKQQRYILLLTLLIFCSWTKAQDLSKKHYYYYKGEKVFLELNYSEISIVSEDGHIVNDKISTSAAEFAVVKSIKGNILKNVVVDKNYNSDLLSNVDIFVSEIKITDNINHSEYFNIIETIQQQKKAIKVSPTYLFLNKKLGISNNFYVKLFKESDLEILYKMASQHSVKVLGNNEFMPLWFTLSCSRETPLNAVEAANIFYESNLFESSEPEFLYHDLLASNDPFFSNQWGLKNAGQYCNTSNIDIRAENAWAITTGSPNIRIAVFDQGIKMDHNDLKNNIHGTGYDAETNTTPSVLRGVHGTPCAGIIGAQQNNNIGISGVAPNSKLMSISINLSWGNTPQQLANGFNWAWQNGADVISNSWGGYIPSSIIEDAIANALAQGRNGKGTVVLFASGNEDNTSIRYPGNSNPDIIVVGAMSPKGERKSQTSCDGESEWGSCYGTELDIVAPGVFIPSTSYNGGYTQSFNGTSSACPHVAGVAALILSVQPNFTQEQVRKAIESTAQKVGRYSYQTASGRTSGTWNNEMGYGLLDAYASVQKANCNTTQSLFNQTITTNTTITNCNVGIQNVTVQNYAKLTIDVLKATTVSGTFTVQSGSSLEVR